MGHPFFFSFEAKIKTHGPVQQEEPEWAGEKQGVLRPAFCSGYSIDIAGASG